MRCDKHIKEILPIPFSLLCYQDFVVDTLGDILQEKEKEESSLPSHDENDDSKENHDDQANEESREDLLNIDLGIGYVSNVNWSPIEVHKNEHDEVGPLIHETMLNKDLEHMDMVVPCDVDISNFFHINEGKWDISNHHFNIDPIYDTDKENDVEVGSPFLQGITHNDIHIHTIERGDHYFPIHEGGLLGVVGCSFRESPIYDTNDDTDRSTTFHLCYRIRHAWGLDLRIRGSKTYSDPDPLGSAQDSFVSVNIFCRLR